jgi:hypothetical protein
LYIRREIFKDSMAALRVFLLMPKRCAASFTVDHSSVTIDIAAWTESVCPRNSDDETTAVTGSSVEDSVSRSGIRETSLAGCITEILQQILILLGYIRKALVLTFSDL